jgi:hypothetical protein
MALTKDLLSQALDALGQVLAQRQQSHEVVAIGGGSLLLLGLIQRPTRDIDLVALVDKGRYLCADPLPASLKQAVEEVGRTFGLASDWMNPGPTDLLRLGLPEGFEGRLVSKTYAALTVHIASRFDQICFKLYASVDQGPQSKHFADLQRLKPTGEELERARSWCVTHDPSPAFSDQLRQALVALEGGDDDD